MKEFNQIGFMELPKEPSSRYCIDGMFFYSEQDALNYLNKKSFLRIIIEVIIKILDLPFTFPNKQITLQQKTKPNPQPKPNR